jgi:hypothetical protein
MQNKELEGFYLVNFSAVPMFPYVSKRIKLPAMSQYTNLRSLG